MTKLKRLSNKTFYNGFGYFILGKTIPEVQFFCSKTWIYLSFTLATKCMYIKVEAVSNDIKVAYFSEIDFEGNLFNENSAHLLYVV